MASYKCDVISIPIQESKEWLKSIGCNWARDLPTYSYLYIDDRGMFYGVDNETFVRDDGEEVSYEEFKTHAEILLLMGNPI